MYFTPDIIFSFFIVVQGICVDWNVLFITVFWDFINKIAYYVLQEIDDSWVGHCEKQSNNSYFSTSSLNIAVRYILLYFLKTCA